MIKGLGFCCYKLLLFHLAIAMVSFVRNLKITNLRYDETLNIKHTQYPDTVAESLKENSTKTPVKI